MPDPSSSADEDACPVGRTLVCAYRLGEPYRCACKSRDALDEIFDIARSHE